MKYLSARNRPEIYRERKNIEKKGGDFFLEYIFAFIGHFFKYRLSAD